VIGQNISFVLVVGTGNCCFKMGMRGKGRLPEKRFIFFQAVVSLRVEVNGTAELLPTGLFSCRNNSKARQR